MLDYGKGIYLYDRDGNAYLDGCSGAMVSNIGHSNTNVRAAMKQQMDKATFGYRLHFENEPAEMLATKTASYMPEGLDRVFSCPAGRRLSKAASSWRGNGPSRWGRRRAGK